jgi:hypothetical protein
MNGLDRFGKPKLCFNCNDPNHVLPCPHERKYPQSAATRITKDPNSIKRIFLEFIEQFTDMEAKVDS